ncbi:unnamed protein product [Euphydryas editha]|uniref:Uncharacterized protein n=1 Tax=Euphydryas editha TaxID=104508 RepID=A0AAU9U3X9_EUPED|nr:unnamed protein product [Euphydryas editha]
MEQISLIPNEILKLIPLFGGDKRQLNLFLRKFEYVIEKFQSSDAQNMYLMHAITSRLLDRAASLISEREDIVSWSDFKELIIQHFGDPRSEECIAIELEILKIKTGESYLDFCNRIQSVRSVLLSKVNQILNEEIKQSKIIIYNHTSLNVFLYNLPEKEVNFQEQYNQRSKNFLRQNNSSTHLDQLKSQNHFNFHAKPNGSSSTIRVSQQCNQQFKFGMPKVSNTGYLRDIDLICHHLGSIYQGHHTYHHRELTLITDIVQSSINHRPSIPFGYKPTLNQHISQHNDVSMRSILPNKPHFPVIEIHTDDNYYHDSYENNDYQEHAMYDLDYRPYYYDHEEILNQGEDVNNLTDKGSNSDHDQQGNEEFFFIRASNTNADALSGIQLNAIDSDDNASLAVSVDEKESRLQDHLREVTDDILQLTTRHNSDESKTITISDSEATISASPRDLSDNELEYPIPSITSSSATETVHSNVECDTSGIPILHEAIDTKPNQILVFYWFKNEIQVRDLSRPKEKIIEVFFP